MSNERTINKVTLVGRLGRQPRIEHHRQKRPICTFSVATRGLKITDTAWHNVVVYGKLAEKCYQELFKGALVYVEGTLQGRTWQGKGEEKQKTYAIYPSVVECLSKKRVFQKNSSDEKSEPTWTN